LREEFDGNIFSNSRVRKDSVWLSCQKHADTHCKKIFGMNVPPAPNRYDIDIRTNLVQKINRRI
jgi:hypothetical protein